MEEDLTVSETEFRARAERALQARRDMPEADRKKLEAVATSLDAQLRCQHCKQTLLEPWLVKDCGHLFCYDCLETLVERKVPSCPACGGGGEPWGNNSFGYYSVAQIADSSRKVVREGAKFVYDDSVDSLVRLFFPDRVEEYTRSDVERERRRIQDNSAREAFERDVHTRLLQPSSTCPGMAAGRSAGHRSSQSLAPAAALPLAAPSAAPHSSRKANGRLQAPPLQLTMPIEELEPDRSGGPAPSGRASAAGDQRVLLLCMPVEYSASPAMVEWAKSHRMDTPERRLPALLKPYFDVPSYKLTLLDLKHMLATLLQQDACLHDKRHDRAARVHADDIELYFDWAAMPADVPPEFRCELPRGGEAAGDGVVPTYSLQAVLDLARLGDIDVDPSLELMYCRRRPEPV